jgi:rRNA maturation endonuclease Nob1
MIGQKRCQACQAFIYWQGLFCPCCGYRLRIGPKNSKNNSMLRIKRKIKQQHQ